MKFKRNFARIILILSVLAWAAILIAVVKAPASAAIERPADQEIDRLLGDDVPAAAKCYMTEEEIQEDYENQKIEAALLEKSHMIEDCIVTWYTADTCNKKPGDPGYGITASGLPVVEQLTCAVETRVIPLYSDVFVQYADGAIEQFWDTDTGVKGNHIDIYTPNYDYAI